MQKINLALPFQLAIDCVANDSFVVNADNSFERQTIERRRFNRRHVFYADEGEIKCARNRRGRKCQNVDQLEQLLEFLLVENAESLLFVDDHEPEVFENDV